MAELRRDPLGIAYDRTWVDSYGTRHYQRDKARGTAGGYAEWSEEHDCNPVCGCHLSAKCMGCGVCMSCDSCYCEEWRY